jgi:glutaredoxin
MKKQFKGVMTIVLFITLLLPASSAVSGEIYKWEDKDGNIVFSDTPPPSGVGVEIKEFKEDTTERSKTGEYSPKVEREGLQERRPYRDIQVIMYMTSWCPYCVKARNYLRSLDVHLIEYNVEQDKARREEMLSKSGGSKGVPLIDVEGIIIRGYNPDVLKRAIENRRDL